MVIHIASCCKSYLLRISKKKSYSLFFFLRQSAFPPLTPTHTHTYTCWCRKSWKIVVITHFGVNTILIQQSVGHGLIRCFSWCLFWLLDEFYVWRYYHCWRINLNISLNIFPPQKWCWAKRTQLQRTHRESSPPPPYYYIIWFNLFFPLLFSTKTNLFAT